jgi:Na+/H+ antiporter NhaD/arsenite permease-like protein
VAALFFGIFICMQAPLQILHVKGPNLGLTTPGHFFWATGSLSSVLDNAPTYVVFFETAKSLPSEGVKTVAGVAESLLVGISLGAVFMGAMTYIGNGPNFMVKAIAEKSGVRMPSFFGYMVYSCLVLLPVLILTTLLFL